MSIRMAPGVARPLLAIAASLIVAAVLALPAAARAAPSVAVTEAWAREARQGEVSAAYMTLTNSGDADDVLLEARSDVAAATEVHQTSMQAGVMRMGPAGPITVPAGGTVSFRPGGYHVMLIGLTQDLPAGAELQLTLVFEQSGEIMVPLTVRGAGG